MPLLRINDKIALFIHVPKTGGTSIVDALACFGSVAFSTKEQPPYLPCTPQHFDFGICSALVPPGFYDYAFAVVRNPYDRIFSEYRYRLDLHRRLPPFDLWWRQSIRRTRQNLFAMDSHLRSCCDLIGENVDVFRFEDGLDTILRSVAERLGVEPPATTPHLRKLPPLPLTVDPRTLEEIARTYHADFLRFGYSDRPDAILERRGVTLTPERRLVSLAWLATRALSRGRRKLMRRLPRS